MAEFFDPDKLLADVRERARAADERGARALARLGAPNATRPSRSLDDLTAAEIERDTRMLKAVTRAWKSKRLRPSRGTSTISLPSGRRLVYDWTGEGKVVR